MNSESISFLNDADETIAGTLHEPDVATRNAVVLGHCFTCSRHTSILRDISKALVDGGIAALRFDFSGNGQSQGIFAETTYTKHIGEMTAAAQFMRSKGYEAFGLAGHSMGASIAVLSASRITGVKGICALAGRLAGTTAAGIFSRDQLSQLDRSGKLSFTSRGRELELKRDFFDDAERYDVSGTVRDLKTPVIIVHGDADDIIPVKEAHDAAALNPRVELEVIAGADHMFLDDAHRRRVADRVRDWFSEMFAP